MSQIWICDYCKTQTDKASLITLLFKEGKNNLERHSICPKCHKALLDILTKPFVAAEVERPSRRRQPITEQETEAAPEPLTGKEKAKAIEEGTLYVPEKEMVQRDKKEGGATASIETVRSTDEEGNCLHINRGRVMGIQKGSIPYQKCRDCGKRIPCKKTDERGLSASPPPGVKFHDQTPK